MSRLTISIVVVSVVCLVKAYIFTRELQSFISHEIVPDVLSVSPNELLSVTFPNGVKALEGNELAPSKVRGVPALEWNYQFDKFYTLIMCDADAPSRIAPEARSFLHWLVVNIPGGNVEEGETLTNILNSHPEPLTGFHRYIFLIYEQMDYIEFNEEPSDSFERRVNFMPEEFAYKYSMGAPLAGNFYLTENFEDLIEPLEDISIEPVLS